MSLADVARSAFIILRGLLRRRLSAAILVALPLGFYVATHDAVGRSVRALVFGLTWALSTEAFFAATAARQLEPRLRLAGRSRAFLLAARLAALAMLSAVIVAAFWIVVAVDQPVRSLGALALDFGVTALVALAFGSAIGALFVKELEGALVLFFFAGMGAIANPFDTYTLALPFWSSRELGTFAIDGPELGSATDGIVHALCVIVGCGLVIAAAERFGSRRPRESLQPPAP